MSNDDRFIKNNEKAIILLVGNSCKTFNESLDSSSSWNRTVYTDSLLATKRACKRIFPDLIILNKGTQNERYLEEIIKNCSSNTLFISVGAGTNGKIEKGVLKKNSIGNKKYRHVSSPRNNTKALEAINKTFDYSENNYNNHEFKRKLEELIEFKGKSKEEKRDIVIQMFDEIRNQIKSEQKK